MAEKRKMIDLSLTETEFKRLLEIKKKLGLPSYSSAVRMLINDAVYFRIDFEGLYAVADEIRRIGTNINQIAKAVNTDNEITLYQIELIKKDMEEIRKYVSEITDDKIRINTYTARETGGDGCGDNEDNQSKG